MADLGGFVRAERKAAGLSMRELAARAEVSSAYLSQVERGRHEPSLTVLAALAEALGLSLAELLGQAGLLDGGERTAPDVAAAIQRDPRLSEAQRFALLSVYRSFVPGA
jgi:transcriptional regulator with XRE-family HTH domain